MPVGNELKRLRAKYPAMEIESVEVTVHPVRAWNDGIRIFPAIKIGDKVLSGVILTPGRVGRFIEEHLESDEKKE